MAKKKNTARPEATAAAAAPAGGQLAASEDGQIRILKDLNSRLMSEMVEVRRANDQLASERARVSESMEILGKKFDDLNQKVELIQSQVIRGGAWNWSWLVPFSTIFLVAGTLAFAAAKAR